MLDSQPGTMRYLEVSDGEAGYEAQVRVADDPVPEPGEVLVRVAGSGLNRADLLQIAGHYPPPPGESTILGLEVSGTRADTGEPVCALLAGGGHADTVAVPEAQIFPAPTVLSLVSAAAIPEAFLTAHLNLVGEADLRWRESLLVHAGASGVGLAAIQIGKMLGARVAATTRSPEKRRAIEEAGADLTIETGTADFAESIEREWGRGSIDVVLDTLGAGSLAGDLRLLKTGGRVVFLSTMTGSRAWLDLAALLQKRARLIGSTLRSRPRAEKARIVTSFAGEMLPAFDRGKLRVSIDSVHRPEGAAAAFTRMRENRNAGKILIDWSETR
ncbi:MAG TPA: NAD(P)H-quinone oxidoreductase [Thermoanaerobaculia bacterium]|nr:NAD(P)H-quinone oxidoreductase [Thermoanaerobaculia bacterium]